MIVIEISIVVMILVLWLKTEVWYEYTKLIGLKRLSLEEQYEQEKQNDITIDYIKFLRKNWHDKFIVRLITCPICLSYWLSFLVCFLSLNILYFPVVFIGSLILYGIVCRILDI